VPTIQKIRKGQTPRAIEWNALADAYNFGTFGTSGPPGNGSLHSAGIVTVKNISGSDRSRFDCMSLGDTVFDIGDDAEEDVLFDVHTADENKTPAILLDSIANGQTGKACIFGFCLAKVGTADSVNDLWAIPDATNHRLEPSGGGSIYLLHPPSTADPKVRPVVINPVSNVAAFRTKTGGISARSTSTIPSASCDQLTIASGTRAVSGNTATVYNLFTSAIGETVDIFAARIGHRWFVIAEDCAE